MKPALWGALLAAAAHPAMAQAPVRSANFYVTPYYDSGHSPFSNTRKVAVGATFDGLLASSNPADILKARDIIVAKPDLITPMTMMVLYARLYDTGRRDEAVYWFYVAKDRFVTLMDVIDLQGSNLGQVSAAMTSFNQLLGPVINGYAFCSIANQQAIRKRAFDYARAHPYQAIFMQQLRARKPGDRKAALDRANAQIADGMGKETAYLVKNAASFMAQRKQNRMDAQYCWK